MSFILGHVRLDLGQFPHLMSQWFGIVPRQLHAATSALRRLERLHQVALLGGKQGPFVFRMARLSAATFLRFPPLPRRFGVRMLGAGGQRRVLQSLTPSLTPQELQLRLQVGHSRQQRVNDLLSFRRLSRNQFFRDDHVHAHCCDTKCPSRSRSVFSKDRSPPCERLRPTQERDGGTECEDKMLLRDTCSVLLEHRCRYACALAALELWVSPSITTHITGV